MTTQVNGIKPDEIAIIIIIAISICVQSNCSP